MGITPSSGNGRLRWIDSVKCLCMLLVLLAHTVLDTSIPFMRTLFQVCALAIPLFFMVTGYVMLNRGPVPASYCMRKIYLILRIALISGLPFWIFYSARCGQWDPLTFVISSCTSLVEKGYNRMLWFLGALAVIYMLLPWLSKATRRTRLIIMIVCACVSFSMYLCNISGHMIENRLSQFTHMWYWLFYFLLGGELATGTAAWSRKMPVWSVALCLALFEISAWVFPADDIDVIYAYGNPALLLTLVAVLGWMSAHESIMPKRLSAFGASLLLGTYVFQTYFFLLVSREGMGLATGTIQLVYTLMASAVIMLAAAIFEYTPGLRRLITLDERRTELPRLLKINFSK